MQVRKEWRVTYFTVDVKLTGHILSSCLSSPVCPLSCLSSPVCQSPLSGSRTAVLLLALCSTSSCARTIPSHPDTGGWTIWMFTHCQVKTNWVLIIINNYYYISIKILYQLWWVINLMLFFLWVPCQSWTLRTLRKSRPPIVTSIKWTTNYNEPFSALLLML